MKKTYKGVLLTLLISLGAYSLSYTDFFSQLGISTVIIGIILGFILGNITPPAIGAAFTEGVSFTSKKILRLGVILYGFGISFHQILDLGWAGAVASSVVVASTVILGTLVGIKVLRLDRELSVLISSGAAICGAAAVMATSSTIKASVYKASVAVGTVVIFGTIAMFLYPFLYKHGFVDLSERAMGIYIGATIHEVAHVVAAGNQLSSLAAQDAITVKMMRVILLVPFLLAIPLFFKSADLKKKRLEIPWFAFMFLGAIGINSAVDLGKNALELIKTLDILLLTMAMSALGFETTIKKVKDVGFKPFLLAGILFFWLIVGGFYIVKLSLSF
ncbi:MAG: YeiH family protein [Helicobacteraceae bacterium]